MQISLVSYFLRTTRILTRIALGVCGFCEELLAAKSHWLSPISTLKRIHRVPMIMSSSGKEVMQTRRWSTDTVEQIYLPQQHRSEIRFTSSLWPIHPLTVLALELNTPPQLQVNSRLFTLNLLIFSIQVCATCCTVDTKLFWYFIMINLQGLISVAYKRCSF